MFVGCVCDFDFLTLKSILFNIRLFEARESIIALD